MSDYTPYKELYLKCFLEDTEQDAEMLFKTVLCKAQLIAEYDGDRPIAMLYLMDSDLIDKNKCHPFYYLYAACTHPDYRGRGIMRHLLKKAKEVAIKNKKLGIFLKPANEPLFDFYASSDFAPFFGVLKISLTAEEFIKKAESLGTLADTAFTELPMKDWHTKRKAVLKDISDLYADFSHDLFTAATDGCRAVCLSSGTAAVYEIRESTLLIKEAVCMPNNQNEIISLATSLLKSANCKSIELRTPSSLNCTLFADFGAEARRFSVLWDNGALPRDTFKNPYHGFAFD